MSIQPYLFFEGRCDEAIAFYQRAVHAKLQTMMRVRESPDAPPPGMLPPGSDNKVMHATLSIGGASIFVSDGRCGGQPRFEGFSLSLRLPTEPQVRLAFQALAEGGTVTMPLGKTFWSPCFGMLTDRFGVGWMLTVDTPPEGTR